MSENMELWESVCVTDPKYTKNFKIGGYSGTAIDPQWQCMKATEKFGPFGRGWGTKDEKYEVIELGKDTKLLLYTGILWYRDAELSITSGILVAYRTSGSSGYVKYDADASKKAQTNGISKGLSKIGFSADVFLGKFDDEKYIQAAKEITAATQTVDAVQLNALGKLTKEADADMEKLFEHYGIESLSELLASKYDGLSSTLGMKIETAKRKSK